MNISRFTPLRIGISISLVLVALFVVQETLLGRWGALASQGQVDAFARVSSGVLRDMRLAIVHCLLAGYLPAAFLHVMQNARRTVLMLEDTLDCSHEECRALAASVRLEPRWLVATAAVGISITLASPYLVSPVPDAPWHPAGWNPEVAWHRVLGLYIGVLIGWLGYAIVSVSLRISRIAHRLQRVDLLDLSPLAPFTRLGMSNALVLIGLLSIYGLVMLETGFGHLILVFASSMFALATLSLVLPVRGVHEGIRRSKSIELTWVNAQIAKQRERLDENEKPRQLGALADLVAWRGLVESVSEWPFTSSTYARLLLYALLPAVSWGIGVVAEEIVGRVLF